MEQTLLSRSQGQPVKWRTTGLLNYGERLIFGVAVAVLEVFAFHSIGGPAFIIPAAASAVAVAMRVIHNHRTRSIGAHRG